MERDYTILPECELIVLICEDNERAYTEIYNRYSPLIYSYSRRLLQNEYLANDVLQDVFIILWEKRYALEISNSLVNYLFGIARHRALSSMKRSQQFQKYRNVLEKTIQYYESSPEDLIIDKETTQIIEFEISKLPEHTKEIIRLSRSGQYTQRQIAEQFNVSPSAIKNQVYHASRKLRLKLHKLLFSLF